MMGGRRWTLSHRARRLADEVKNMKIVRFAMTLLAWVGIALLRLFAIFLKVAGEPKRRSRLLLDPEAGRRPGSPSSILRSDYSVHTD